MLESELEQMIMKAPYLSSTGIDRGRSNSLSDAQSSSERTRIEQTSERWFMTPSSSSKQEPWPSEFVTQ